MESEAMESFESLDTGLKVPKLCAQGKSDTFGGDEAIINKKFEKEDHNDGRRFQNHSDRRLERTVPFCSRGSTGSLSCFYKERFVLVPKQTIIRIGNRLWNRFERTHNFIGIRKARLGYNL
jgi:hypothetical protein